MGLCRLQFERCNKTKTSESQSELIRWASLLNLGLSCRDREEGQTSTKRAYKILLALFGRVGILRARQHSLQSTRSRSSRIAKNATQGRYQRRYGLHGLGRWKAASAISMRIPTKLWSWGATGASQGKIRKIGCKQWLRPRLKK